MLSFAFSLLLLNPFLGNDSTFPISKVTSVTFVEDSAVVFVGRSMFWYPTGHISIDEIRQEISFGKNLPTGGDNYMEASYFSGSVKVVVRANCEGLSADPCAKILEARLKAAQKILPPTE